MTKAQQGGLLVVLVCVMVVVYLRAFSARPVHSASAPPPSMTTSNPLSNQDAKKAPAVRRLLETSEAPLQRTQQRQHSEQLGWKRDPFTHGAALGGISGMTLNGILWDPRQPIAMINDQMLHVGESLEGYTIVEITQDHVSVTDGTETFQLQVAP